MFRVLALFVASALAYSPHHESFLSAKHHDEPEEVMGPNMNFTPVSTTMQCTISLTLQFMLVFTALGLCRTYLDLTDGDHKTNPVQLALKAASETVFYAPMVCLMFVGFRMRVLQLSKGTGNPQDWVRYSMQAVAYSILANTLLVLIIPACSKTEAKDLNGEKGELNEDVKPFEPGMLMYIFTAIRYLTFLGLYVGFGAVVTGVFMYEPPAGTWEGEVPALSPAVSCTMQLSTAFFLVYFLHAVSRTYTQLSQSTKSNGSKDFEETMERAADTMSMAPMLCVLFLAARMRALQMDPAGGNPQRWAQNCFYTCTYAITFQTFLAIFVKYALGGKAKKVEKGGIEGNIEYEATGTTAKVLNVCRWIIMITVYTGAVAIVCSVFTIEHPDGKEHTPALSPTMQCVLNLAFQYFFIYFLLWVFFTIKDFGYEHAYLKNAEQAIESAKTTVQFAPMLCVLFIATRMRALQISENKGSPQGWAQDGMYLASWSVLIQFWMCLIMPFFVNNYAPDSLDGPVKGGEEVSNKYYGAYVVTFIRYAALLALIGGVATVITSVFLITPETANGRGAIPLISDGTLGVNLAPEVPGVNDVPGAAGAMEATGGAIGTGANAAATVGDTVASPVAAAGDTVADTVA